MGAPPKPPQSPQAHCSRPRPQNPAHPPPPPGPPRSLLVAKGAAKEADGFVNVGAKIEAQAAEIEEIQKDEAEMRKMLHKQAEHIAKQAAQIEHLQEHLQALVKHLHHRD